MVLLSIDMAQGLLRSWLKVGTVKRCMNEQIAKIFCNATGVSSRNHRILHESLMQLTACKLNATVSETRLSVPHGNLALNA